jgi:hypothetical protein
MAGIEAAEEQRVGEIQAKYLQMETVGPGEHYAGIFMSDLPKGPFPQTVKLTVRWLGHVRDFFYTVEKK